MALKGFSESLGARGVQTDLKVAGAASAGTLYMLGSQTGYVQLASQAVSHVLDWDVDNAGLSLADRLSGVEKKVTKTDEPAILRPLAPGDTIRTDQLASGADVGAISGTTAPNASLGVSAGKLRVKQAVDAELFRLASDGGNLFNTDGTIWAECVALVP